MCKSCNLSDEERKRRRDSAKARWADPIFRAKMKAIMTSPKYVEQHREASLGRWADPNIREAHSKQMQQRYEDHPEIREKQSKSHRRNYQENPKRAELKRREKQEWWANLTEEGREEVRLKMRQTANVRCADPKWRQGLRERTQHQWARPGYREAHCIPCKAETRSKISKAHIGLKHTSETRAFLSKRMIEINASNQPNLSGYKRSLKGYFWSEKNKTKIWYASSYEEIAYKILEVLSKVSSYGRCQHYVEYQDLNGDIRRYIPDIFVQYTDGTSEIIEVKPQFKLAEPLTQLKLSAAKAKFGNEFVVWTEKQLGLIVA